MPNLLRLRVCVCTLTKVCLSVGVAIFPCSTRLSGLSVFWMELGETNWQLHTQTHTHTHTHTGWLMDWVTVYFKVLNEQRDRLEAKESGVSRRIEGADIMLDHTHISWPLPPPAPVCPCCTQRSILTELLRELHSATAQRQDIDA